MNRINYIDVRLDQYKSLSVVICRQGNVDHRYFILQNLIHNGVSHGDILYTMQFNPVLCII